MSPSILIIKEPKPSQELRTALHSEGYSVREAHNAADGMRSFLHNSPDLVLLDLSLDGMQLLHDMKNARGSVPIIALSQYSSVNDAVSAFKAGAWDYITTPIANMQVFINSLRNCLSQSRLRKRVQESQQHLFLLIQNLPVIIFIINRNLEFEFLSQATERILGYTHQEILQSPKSFLRCIVPEDRKKFLNGLRQAMHAEGQQRRLDFRFRHKKGYQVFLQAQSIIRPERNIALPEYLEGMLLDVTRSTYMDSLLHQNEKLEMLRSMTEDVAHEIRNPLVSLGGFARQLRAKFPQALETEVILKECARLERLLQRMNAYLEPLHIELKPCSLSAALAFAIRLLRNRLERKAIQFEINGDCAPVCADQEFLHRVFIYILGYAATILQPHGTLDIQSAQSQDLAYVIVTCTPVVGTPADENKLFMPIEDSAQNLSICYRLVERMHGRLHLERLESTARITLSLPIFHEENASE